MRTLTLSLTVALIAGLLSLWSLSGLPLIGDKAHTIALCVGAVAGAYAGFTSLMFR